MRLAKSRQFRIELALQFAQGEARLVALWGQHLRLDAAGVQHRARR
jgi:hypothetical protein